MNFNIELMNRFIYFTTKFLKAIFMISPSSEGEISHFELLLCRWNHRHGTFFQLVFWSRKVKKSSGIEWKIGVEWTSWKLKTSRRWVMKFSPWSCSLETNLWTFIIKLNWKVIQSTMQFSLPSFFSHLKPSNLSSKFESSEFSIYFISPTAVIFHLRNWGGNEKKSRTAEKLYSFHHHRLWELKKVRTWMRSWRNLQMKKMSNIADVTLCSQDGIFLFPFFRCCFLSSS